MEDLARCWHDACYAAFSTLQDALGEGNKHEDELPREVVADLFGRFNIWAGNIGAGQQGQASLDYRLRKASEIKHEVVQLLQCLTQSLQEATSIVSGTRLPYDQLSSDSDSSVSSLSDNSVQGTNSLGKAIEVLPGTELEEIQRAISTYLSILYRVSIIIRRNPAPHDRLIKSAKIDTSFYEFFDERHVLEKFPTADPILVERLGRAIWRRRKYFKYREQHRQKLSRQTPLQSLTPVGQEIKTPSRRQEDPEPSAHGGGAKAGSKAQAPSLVQPSVTKQSTTASTLLLPNTTPHNVYNLDQQSDAGTQTSYGSDFSRQRDKVALPPIPRSSEGGPEFECPYCFTICHLRGSDSVKRNKEWKRHILRDLQPYICTFGGCSKKDALFERRRDWINHELHSHRTEWYCNVAGHSAYESKKKFQDHMRSEHIESVDERQLDTLTKMVARPAVDLKFSCPLSCTDIPLELTIDKLEAHLGGHLEAIASFALPTNVNESHGSDGSAVTQNAIRQERNNSETTESLNEDSKNSGLGSKTLSQDEFDELNQAGSHVQPCYRDLLEFVEENRSRFPASSLVYLDRIESEVHAPITSGDLGHFDPSTASLNNRETAKQILSCVETAVGFSEDLNGSTQVVKLLLETVKVAKSVLVNFLGVSASDAYYHDTVCEVLKLLAERITTSVQEDEGIKLDVEVLESLRLLYGKLCITSASQFMDAESDHDWEFLRSETGQPAVDGPLMLSGNRTLEQICDGLSKDDQSDLLARLHETIISGTTDWIFRRLSYLQVRYGNRSVLLLQGLPGCGKTILVSAIVRSVQRQISGVVIKDEERHPLGCAYYFFQHRIVDAEQQMEQPLRFMVAQLLKQAKVLSTGWQEGDRIQQLSATAPFTEKVLIELLQFLFTLFEETIIILDALDLCTDSMIRMFSRIVQDAAKQNLRVRVIATSRISLLVQEAIGDRPSQNDTEFQLPEYIECAMVSREAVESDIKIMTETRLNSLVSRGLGPKSDVSMIPSWSDDLASCSKGMFIWANARLQQLESSNNLEMLRNSTTEIPSSLSQLWIDILERLSVQAGPEYTTLIRDILNLLFVCERDLNAQEVYEISGIVPYHDRFLERQGDNLWRRVPALLELAGQPGKDGYAPTDNLGLIHPSLREMLQSDATRKGPLSCFSIDADAAHQSIAERCITQLLRYSSYRSYGWSAYAGAYWHIHVKTLGNKATQEIARNSIQLLDSRTASFAHWQLMSRQEATLHSRLGNLLEKADGSNPSPLYYAALLGLPKSAELLLRDGADPNSIGGEYRYPLFAVVVAGEVELVELLANSGADIDSREDGSGKTAVHLAAEDNHPQCLDKLATFHADLNARDEYGNAPLHLAARHGHIDCMHLLLSLGADIEAEDDDLRTPVAMAARTWQQGALTWLLEKGAKVDARSKYGTTALCYAVMNMDAPMVRTLLEAGAYPNWRTEKPYGGTPLHIAAKPRVFSLSEEEERDARREIVEILLDNSANPAIRDENGHFPDELTSDPEIKARLHRLRSFR
ncbi:MAG: hypothetical protein Q9200_003777 [Gallowayella weberi]